MDIISQIIKQMVEDEIESTINSKANEFLSQEIINENKVYNIEKYDDIEVIELLIRGKRYRRVYVNFLATDEVDVNYLTHILVRYGYYSLKVMRENKEMTLTFETW